MTVGIPVELTILEGNDATYLKLPVMDFGSPVKLFIKYLSASNTFENINARNLEHDKSFDLAIYKSNTVTMPNKFKNDLVIINKPKVIALTSIDLNTGSKKPIFD